jgi:RNA methyltransferase, TrmH family
MISKAKSKFIKSLQIKKYRKQEQSFVVEGKKSVSELIRSDYEVTLVVATDEFLSGQRAYLSDRIEVIESTDLELSKLGEFQTNDAALAIARMRPNKPISIDEGEFGLMLDDIRDPGNLGTIIRTADWYGISKIIASEHTADIYSSKAISATMGSFLRVDIFYTSLSDYVDKTSQNVLGAFLEGENVHSCSFGKGGILVIGNESHGISDQVSRRVNQKITIPKYGRAESLNAAVATAIILDSLRRTQKKD